MASTTTNDTSNGFSDNAPYEINETLRFWLFLVSDTLSFVCTIFVLYHLLIDRKLRNAIRNHAFIIILLAVVPVQLIDLPLYMQYLSTHIIRPARPFTCLLWWYIDWACYYIIEVLVAFASIERHILIFHSQLVATRRGRWVFHYVPLLLIISFMMMFYIVAIFTPICESIFDYTADVCGLQACYATIPFLAFFEQIGFSIAPGFLIAISNITLLARVIRQKYRIHGLVQWRKQQRLAVQMITLSLLYLVFSFPLSVIYLVRFFTTTDWASEVAAIYFFIGYYTILLFPFVCLSNTPDLWKKLNRCNLRRRRQVVAITIRPQTDHP